MPATLEFWHHRISCGLKWSAVSKNPARAIKVDEIGRSSGTSQDQNLLLAATTLNMPWMVRLGKPTPNWCRTRGDKSSSLEDTKKVTRRREGIVIKTSSTGIQPNMLKFERLS